MRRGRLSRRPARPPRPRRSARAGNTTRVISLTASSRCPSNGLSGAGCQPWVTANGETRKGRNRGENLMPGRPLAMSEQRMGLPSGRAVVVESITATRSQLRIDIRCLGGDPCLVHSYVRFDERTPCRPSDRRPARAPPKPHNGRRRARERAPQEERRRPWEGVRCQLADTGLALLASAGDPGA